MDTPVDVDVVEDPMLTPLIARQKRRAQDSLDATQKEAEQRCARAKPKAAKRQSKRSKPTSQID